MTNRRQDHAITSAKPGHDHLDMAAVIAPPLWTEEAICSSVDPDLFFPEKGGSVRAAKAICRGCPVRTECLEYALAFERGDNGTHTSYAEAGIYGGLAPRERRALRRNLKESA